MLPVPGRPNGIASAILSSLLSSTFLDDFKDFEDFDEFEAFDDFEDFEELEDPTRGDGVDEPAMHIFAHVESKSSSALLAHARRDISKLERFIVF